MDNDNEATAPITRRDLFAAAALSGLLASGAENAAEAVLEAKGYADTMIAVLDGRHDADGSVKP
jgi:hypothetical protein